jgi:hypothetical protein
MTDRFVKPAPGLLVRDPRTMAPLPEAGAWVPGERHWLRLLKAGDVIDAEPPPDPAATGKKRK